MTDAPSATAKPVPAEIAALSFEQALAELEQIVGRLESGQAELEQSIELYSRGAQLKQHCESRLSQARLRVERIVLGTDGQPKGTEPADFG